MSYEKAMTIFLTFGFICLILIYFAFRWEAKEERKNQQVLARKRRILEAREKKALFRKKRLKMKSIKYQRRG
ncbi:MAG: hypothetical protein C0603_10565 [Denitrovibrio sp.]|nr:MAG: hypothetical protein C0603_10565 [Denitrovibrio sp.]